MELSLLTRNGIRLHLSSNCNSSCRSELKGNILQFQWFSGQDEHSVLCPALVYKSLRLLHILLCNAHHILNGQVRMLIESPPVLRTRALERKPRGFDVSSANDTDCSGLKGMAASDQWWESDVLVE